MHLYSNKQICPLFTMYQTIVEAEFAVKNIKS